ncbi:MAG: ATP phosphoribosyltransferase [Bernardetiaceae bacterium]|nr:ATP phosphoribosyltransferase [Bernardetiaceae bacterium]
MQKKLRIALQKSGRLYEDSMALLKACGFSVEMSKNRLKAQVYNFPCELLFLRVGDIPAYVEDGTADLGIIGENTFLESDCDISVRDKLGFSRCKLSLAIPREIDYIGVSYFEGKQIATSYPTILADFLEKNAIKASIHTINGSVEIAPSIGLADGVFDIVSTGGTLLSNGLKEVEVVMHSEAVLVAHPQLEAEKEQLLHKLLFRIEAHKKARDYKYILLNAPESSLEDIKRLIPGMKSPTILPLATEGWISLHSVIKEDHFWEIIEKLKALGAEGILIAPIEKMIL